MSKASNTAKIAIRPACEGDLDALCTIEALCFATDRLSRRRFRHWIAAHNREFLVAQRDTEILGYGLVLLHRGTRLARLYSLAVSPAARGTGLGRTLMNALEHATAERTRLYMRLEVAEDNHAAIALYKALGYVAFGSYEDYYEDHQSALRMQKRIRYVSENMSGSGVPWYQQTTPFSCGPAATMMAMGSLEPGYVFKREEELDIWREATTIYMTAGHGGCHPVGLALAAQKRGFVAKAYINKEGPLFVEGVRDMQKKTLISLVHAHFMQQAKQNKLKVHIRDVSQADIARWIKRGAIVVALISTYRMDRKKAPHWVTLTSIDEKCLYLHDPDPTEGEQTQLDCQSMPIARADFSKMSLFGRERLRTVVVIEKAKTRKTAAAA
jgi:ribosomal protein S18 acetylase RimI-like enzyme